MKTYKTQHPIANINIGLGETEQDIDIENLHEKLYKGLTAENYLLLYSMMRSKIEIESQQGVRYYA